MEIGTEMALRYLGMRVALAGDGGIHRHDDGKDEVTAVIPGGSTVSFGRDGMTVLKAFDGKIMGSGSIRNPAFFASLMHNCDVMMGYEYGPGSVEVVDFADAVLDADDAGLSVAISPSRPGQVAGAIDFSPLLSDPAIKAAADSVHPEIRAGYHAWRASRGNPSAAAKWDDIRSLIRWNGRIASLTNKEDPVPSENGNWVRVESQVGRIEAARSIGVLEGELGDFDGDRSLYALKSAGVTGVEDGTVIAVSVFEEGTFVSLLRHADRARRPALRLSGDLVVVIEAVEGFHRQNDLSPRSGTWM